MTKIRTKRYDYWTIFLKVSTFIFWTGIVGYVIYSGIKYIWGGQ